MDYLKNIVVQYMSFPVQSSEKISLIPVIAMLLQFTAKVKGLRGVREVGGDEMRRDGTYINHIHMHA